jgi:hypothetical protein
MLSNFDLGTAVAVHLPNRSTANSPTVFPFSIAAAPEVRLRIIIED